MGEPTAPSDKNLILTDQVKELYAASHVSNSAAVVISSLLALILWQETPHTAILIWFAYTLLVTLYRFLTTTQYKHFRGQSKTTKHWLNIYIIGVVLSGIGWGSILVFVTTYGNVYNIVSTVFVICGLVTGSAASLASLKYGFATFAIPALLPGAIYLVLLNQLYTAIIGASIFLFLIFISCIALRIHKTILYGIKIQFQNAKTIVELEQQNQELKLRNDSLEKQIVLSIKKTQKFRDQLRSKATDKYSTARESKLKTLLDKLNGGLWDCNLKTGETSFSPSWLEMLGYSRDDVQPTMDFWKSILHPDEKQDVLDRLNMHIKGHSPNYSSSHRLLNKDGKWVWVMSRGQGVIWDTYGEVLSLASIDIIISDSNDDLSSKLNTINFDINDWFSTTDQFMEHLHNVSLTVAVENVEHVLCHFKVFPISNSEEYRPELVSQLLSHIGKVLLKENRNSDAIVNFGSNGYGLIIEYCSINFAWEKAKSLQSIFKSYQHIHGEDSYKLGVCIGITPIIDTDESVEDILKDAEMACDIARTKSPEHIYIYQGSNKDLGRNFFEKHVLAQIQDAIANKGIQLSALPINATANAENTDEKLFLIQASLASKEQTILEVDFKSIVDGNNLSTKIDHCSMELLYNWVTAQPKSYNNEQFIYIIACASSSLNDESFMEYLQNIANEQTLSKHVFCFSVSEQTLVAQPAEVEAFFASVKAMGFRVALSQFGSTTFTYDYLKSLPIDYLILDNKLIEKIETDKASMLTVKYINELSHTLNLKTIAINIHSVHLMKSLEKFELDYIQGGYREDKRVLNINTA